MLRVILSLPINIRCSAADTPPDEDLLKRQGRHHEERDTLRCWWLVLV